MTAVGGALLGCASLLLLKCYSSYVAARRDECLGFLSLLRELERGMSLYLDAPRLAVTRHKSDALERLGFLERLRDGATLAEAFMSVEGSLAMPPEAKRILTEYFSRLGGGYLDGELRALSRAISELEPIAKKESDDAVKRIKVAGVLIFSVTAGALILLL